MAEFWLAVVVIVFIGCATAVIIVRSVSAGSSAGSEEELEDLKHGLNNRLSSIEDRLGNLETLVVEKEKHEKFEKAL